MWPAWEVQDHEQTTSWFSLRLDLPQGAVVDVLAVVSGGCVAIEEVRAEPPLSLDDLAALADRIEEPLLTACGAWLDPAEEAEGAGRIDVPRGVEGWRLVAEEYRAAQEKGADPVLAVMSATGHSRRRALKLIGAARDAGFLTPRHIRR
ncbi:DUF6214 family protein [Streptomyces sp. RY43-2]|uniref:DUF6214 family protein n=1 Tax=Streptomyces macrolidinus TaxID=2952607 RepID=A0ABT0Z997_9ACTN|nr:DUF6214 family protein [Streptomyces macrolidinus]MCN9240321.1 DUF6214 family protein [Streptomyces macrolidinus]